MHKLGMSLFAGALTIAAMGCDDGAIDKSEQAIRCERIGKRVHECNSSVDAEDFRKECVDKSSNDDFQQQAKDCDECLNDDRSCAENTAQCAADCLPVVPLTAANSK